MSVLVGRQTPESWRPMPQSNFEFYGGNAEFYNSHDKEILASGPAGSGKTLAALAKLHTLATYHPGARLLIVRKTRSALTESALVTYERDILGGTDPIITKNPNQRKVRQSYRYPNGSEIIVGGMDKPEKTLSTEYDCVYIQEATELELEEYEVLLRSLRAGKVRIGGRQFNQILMDCNPTYPHHWLYKRFSGGPLKNFVTTHKDNPRFYNRLSDRWTNDGEQYLETLNNLTGFLRKRFLEGIWAAAEGLVYDQFDENIHTLPHTWEPPKDWKRYHSIDFGFTNPISYGFYAQDHDGRLYCYREFYETKLLVEDLAKRVKDEIDLGNEPRPEFVVGDHDAEDRATFERHSGLKIRPADKRIKAGIQLMQSRFRVQKDGKPRIFFKKQSVARVDRQLSAMGKPSCGIEELSAYCWDSEKDEPVDDNNHFCDQARYLCMQLDGTKKTLTLGVR